LLLGWLIFELVFARGEGGEGEYVDDSETED
jgi:hypothetical protein